MKKIHAALVICVLTLSLAGGAAFAQTKNEDCSCTGAACGNGAVGGNQGDIFVNITPANVQKYFTGNPNTGWTCVVPAKVNGSGGPLGCFCKGYCGNGGIGANPNTFNLGLSQATIDAQYGGGKAGNKTGWLCGTYRGSFNPANDKIKQ